MATSARRARPRTPTSKEPLPETARIRNETAQRVLKAARELLMEGGYARFSMRNVAAQAGLHLANVQYYFPGRDALVRGLFESTGEQYRSAYERLLAKAPPDPRARFEAVLEFNLEDIVQARTRRFFMQLWALLNTLDGDSDALLGELYDIDIAQLSERIAELDPAAPATEIRRRATLLAAVIEGLMVVHSAHSRAGAERKELMSRARALGLEIALGHAPSAP